MRLIIVVSLCAPLIFLLVAVTLPAHAERHDVITVPPIRCGLHCVVDTTKFDNKEEAEEFAAKYGVEAKVYPNNPNAWFVERHMTESESNLL